MYRNMYAKCVYSSYKNLKNIFFSANLNCVKITYKYLFLYF